MHIEKLCFNFTIFKTIYQVYSDKTKIFARTFVGTQRNDKMNIATIIIEYYVLHIKNIL